MSCSTRTEGKTEGYEGVRVDMGADIPRTKREDRGVQSRQGRLEWYFLRVLNGRCPIGMQQDGLDGSHKPVSGERLW